MPVTQREEEEGRRVGPSHLARVALWKKALGSQGTGEVSAEEAERLIPEAHERALFIACMKAAGVHIVE